ncbi:heterodisulfide reductase-related iron-sulfur binding cluster [uncultured Friedmanniella sp.]|uniref:heterodisulfide reductase-related iron-sulfur binding cluster n=1 Tax=uncultured Friedmanniella sp. TaxID=335381 RepID=UPI0035CC44BD
MCQTACPVLINTGDLVKRLRREDQSSVAAAAWTQAAKHWGVVAGGGSLALTAAAAVPGALAPAVGAVNRLGRRVVGTDQLPLWSSELPSGGASRRRPAVTAEPDAVYLPACVNTMFGPTEGDGVQVSFEKLCARAGLTLLVPAGIDGLCCGTPWSSKGLPDGYAAMRAKVLPLIYAATRDGDLPVVVDASSCTEGFFKMLASDADGPAVRVVDAVQFVAERVLPLLGSYERLESVSVHPTCSSTQLGLNSFLGTVAAGVATEVQVPLDWQCCAFAGDRGLLHPELTASATAAEAAEVEAYGASAHASCNRTCELEMTRATGKPYRHILELLVEVAEV